MKIKKLNEINGSEEIITKVPGKFFSHSVSVSNNREILQWMVDSQTNSFKNNEKMLSSNLITELTELFGTYNKGLRLEFLTKLWILKYKELTFNIFTAKGKGTSIEVCDMTYEDVRNGKNKEEIIEFLKTLHNLVNN